MIMESIQGKISTISVRNFDVIYFVHEMTVKRETKFLTEIWDFSLYLGIPYKTALSTWEFDRHNSFFF